MISRYRSSRNPILFLILEKMPPERYCSWGIFSAGMRSDLHTLNDYENREICYDIVIKIRENAS